MSIKAFKKALSQNTDVTIVGPLMKKIPKRINHPFIYVDRGAEYRNSLEKKAKKGYQDFSVGDGDSSKCRMDLKLSPEKNYSDFKFALDLLPSTIERVNLYGFLGGRRDHELINFGEVHNWLLKSKNKTLFSFDGKVLAKGYDKLSLKIKGIFSLVVFEKTSLKILGNCKYKLDKYKEFYPLSSQGLSNEGNGLVSIESKGPFFVFLP